MIHWTFPLLALLGLQARALPNALNERGSCPDTGTTQTNPTSLILQAGMESSNNAFADPRGLFYEGTYYAYGTNTRGNNPAAPGPNVNWATSTCPNSGWTWQGDDGQNNHQDLLPHAGSWNNQSNPGVWDPYTAEITNTGTGSPYFLMWYAAIKNNAGNSQPRCISVASSENPNTVFTPISSGENGFLLCDGEAISPQYFVDPMDGEKYLVYKQGNGEQAGSDPGASSRLTLVQLTQDGKSLKNGDGNATVLYYSVPQYTSGGRQVNNPYDQDAESPSLTASRNEDGSFTYFLLYVVNQYSTNAYAIHYVTSSSVWGHPQTAPHGSSAPQGTYTGMGHSQNGYIIGTNLTGTSGLWTNPEYDDVALLAPGGPSFLYANGSHGGLGANYITPNEMMFMSDDAQVAPCDQVAGNHLRGPRMSKVQFSGTTMSFAPEGDWGTNLANNTVCAST